MALLLVIATQWQIQGGLGLGVVTNVKLLPLDALPPAVVFPLHKLIPVLRLGVGTSEVNLKISIHI